MNSTAVPRYSARRVPKTGNISRGEVLSDLAVVGN
jgi:hypothetical protein